MQILQKKEAVKVGWELTKKHLGFAIIVYAIYIGVTIGISALQITAERFMSNSILSFNITILEYLVMILLGMGFIKIFLDIYDGKKAEISTLFTTYEQYFGFFICYLLVTLIVAAGIILLIVPGIIWALKYQFALYLVIDRKMKPIDAIKMSGKMTQGHKVNLFLFWWVVLGVCILGFLCCCVGIIPAAIVTVFAYIHIYRTILLDYEKGQSSSGNGPIPETRPTTEVKQDENMGNPISETKPE
ncbi:MAG: hypothetical protein A2231_05115 [Candidatus Firestonebacteria bacterium RIFOXYA2_FULL_40_8]|nr:MAG: hypothetical protein A2231_05115 [Candidatus Firestonebacteria bacterium RIFOXYA2_FULL_40_8]